MMLPSVNSTTSAPGNLIYISWLNGWPVNTPVNASPHTSRYATHDSGTLWIAGPSMVGDFHPLISTGLPAHYCIYNQYKLDLCRCLVHQVAVGIKTTTVQKLLIVFLKAGMPPYLNQPEMQSYNVILPYQLKA
uniref:Error-prone repair protein UmuD n=1 Tax=Klebsiella pneumoniae TaxID=573 RepID=A0A8B0SV71_KLEPN|nr:Error-prone repair protein UmuD [Klebsiella pneumoniae]